MSNGLKPETKRQRLEILRSQLEQERATFVPHWKAIAEVTQPRRARFTMSDANKGDRRNQAIVDNTPMLAARTLRSGMMAGITSPARPWFRLATPDPDMMDYGPVKEWTHTVGQRMGTAYLRSNLYNILPLVYGDLGNFATAPVSVEEHFGDFFHFNSFPIGSYRIAKDHYGRVNVFNRDFRMTVRQLVHMFGRYDEHSGRAKWEAFSTHVKDLYDKSEYETWIDVVHFIQPNEEYDDKKVDARFKKFSSCYYEMGGGSKPYLKGTDQDRYLRESGYDLFPILCPRWEVTGEDVYGTDCPGMAALGDIKQLNLGEKRIMQAIEKMVNPPMLASTNLKNQPVSIIAGGVTYVDDTQGQSGLRPTHEINPRIAELEQKQAQVRNRIQRTYYEDLFLMLANSDRRQITAREIEERHEEKLLALGPVLEQLNQDLLDPLIDITFDILSRQGQIPPPPEELQGVKLKVEYISMMAQAQKLVSVGSVERFAGFASQIVTSNPEALDKIDTDQILDVYADITSIPPGIVRSDEDVEKIRANRAQAQQQQAAGQQLRDVTDSAKNLSQIDMGADSALKQLVNQSQAGSLTPA